MSDPAVKIIGATPRDRLQAYLDQSIKDATGAILRDALGGTNTDQVALNYKASCRNLANLQRIRDMVPEFFKEESAGHDGLEEMEESSERAQESK